MNKLMVIDSTVQETYVWLKELKEDLHTEETQLAYQALRVVLHGLRDRLPVEEAADLGAQFPMLIRGLYYEGWHPAGKPLKIRSQQEFLDHINKDLWKENEDPIRLCRAVFALLDRRISAGEVRDVRGNLPGEIQALWPAPHVQMA
jgi:uncharacterized protein (DUF2267 family)